MKKLLLIIDYQVDFVAGDGALTAGKAARDIEGNILARIDAFRAAGDDILCTLDTHDAGAWAAGHPEGKLFPLHCAPGAGHELYGRLASLGLKTLEKKSYMMDQSDIRRLVRRYALIEFAGVTTDICVLQNAIGLYNDAANRQLPVTFQVHAGCVASFDPAGHAWALDYMKRILGFTVLFS